MSQDEHFTTERDTEPAQNDGDKAHEEQIVRLDNFFSSLQPGVSILIERLKPTWCSGLLEEIQITEDGIDLDYMIETWGGQLLAVKMRGKGGRLVGGSYKVPLYSYPPLRYGQKLKPYDRGERFMNGEPPTPVQNSPVVVNQPPGLEKILSAIPAIMPLITSVMERSEARNQQNMQMMMAMLRSNQGSGLADISKIGTVMTQLNDLFKQNSSSGDQMGEIDFMTQAMDVMKMFLDKPKQPQPQSIPQARLTGPTSKNTKNARGQLSGQSPIQDKPDKITELNPSSSIAAEIAKMSPELISDTLLNSISKMSPEKRDATIANFIGEFQNFMEEEGLENADDDRFEENDQRDVK